MIKEYTLHLTQIFTVGSASPMKNTFNKHFKLSMLKIKQQTML